MLCQNCGRQVEFVGNVCPWCGAPKLQSQTIQIFFYIWGFIGMCVGAGIGYLTIGDEGAYIGGLIGEVIAVVIGIIKGSAANKR